MAHECGDCGVYCFCDMEDTVVSQPEDCIHLTQPTTCEANDPETDYDDDGFENEQRCSECGSLSVFPICKKCELEINGQQKLPIVAGEKG